MKFIFVVGGHFCPIAVDDINIDHDSAIIIEDENKNYRFSLGMDRDDKLSRPYHPYFARVLTKDKIIKFRDALTRLIDLDN